MRNTLIFLTAFLLHADAQDNGRTAGPPAFEAQQARFEQGRVTQQVRFTGLEDLRVNAFYSLPAGTATGAKLAAPVVAAFPSGAMNSLSNGSTGVTTPFLSSDRWTVAAEPGQEPAQLRR